MRTEDIDTIIRDDELVNDFEFGIRISRAVFIEDIRHYAAKKMLIYSGTC
jgi:hypothetical protein